MSAEKNDYKVTIRCNTFHNRKEGRLSTETIHSEVVPDKTFKAMRKVAMDIANEHCDFTDDMTRKNWIVYRDGHYMTRSIEHRVRANRFVYLIEVDLQDGVERIHTRRVTYLETLNTRR